MPYISVDYLPHTALALAVFKWAKRDLRTG